MIRLDLLVSGLLETPAPELARDLHARHRFSRLVVGEDFRFGHGRGEPRRLCRIWGLNWALRCTPEDVQVEGERVLQFPHQDGFGRR